MNEAKNEIDILQDHQKTLRCQHTGLVSFRSFRSLDKTLNYTFVFSTLCFSFNLYLFHPENFDGNFSCLINKKIMFASTHFFLDNWPTLGLLF